MRLIKQKEKIMQLYMHYAKLPHEPTHESMIENDPLIEVLEDSKVVGIVLFENFPGFDKRDMCVYQFSIEDIVNQFIYEKTNPLTKKISLEKYIVQAETVADLLEKCAKNIRSELKYS